MLLLFSYNRPPSKLIPVKLITLLRTRTLTLTYIIRDRVFFSWGIYQEIQLVNCFILSYNFYIHVNYIHKISLVQSFFQFLNLFAWIYGNMFLYELSNLSK